MPRCGTWCTIRTEENCTKVQAYRLDYRIEPFNQGIVAYQSGEFAVLKIMIKVMEMYLYSSTYWMGMDACMH